MEVIENKKTFESFLKQGNEGHPFRDVIVGLGDEQIIEAAEDYASYMIEYKRREDAAYTELVYQNSLQDKFDEGYTLRMDEDTKLLNSIDEFLCHIENFLHGKDGEEVTDLRGKIHRFLEGK